MDIVIPPTDRALFLGKTGSGKTTLAKALLNTSNRPYVVLDPKHRYRDGDVPVARTYKPKLDAQIVRVDPIGGPDEIALWDNEIYRIWSEGDTIIYIDELTLISPPRSVPTELGRAIRTGRERGIAVWVGSQRPKDIPSIVFTEAEHFFCFRLTWEADREKVCSFTSSGMWRPYERMQKEGKSAKHDFMYFGIEDDRMIRFRATGIT